MLVAMLSSPHTFPMPQTVLNGRTWSRLHQHRQPAETQSAPCPALLLLAQAARQALLAQLTASAAGCGSEAPTPRRLAALGQLL